MHLIDITSDDLIKSYKQIKNELRKYSIKLSKKNELVVLNKIDLVENKKELKKIIRDFSKNVKSEVFTISTFKKDSISKIKSKLLSYVS